MKALAKTFNAISQFYRLITSIFFFVMIFFTGLVDKKILFAFFDLGGVKLSSTFLKTISIICAFAFFIFNIYLYKKLKKAKEKGEGLISNLIISIILMTLIVLSYLYYKDSLSSWPFFLCFALNFVLFLGSIFAMVAKSHGAYKEKKQEAEKVVVRPVIREENKTVKPLDQTLPLNEERKTLDKENSQGEIIEKPKTNKESSEKEGQKPENPSQKTTEEKIPNKDRKKLDKEVKTYEESGDDLKEIGKEYLKEQKPLEKDKKEEEKKADEKTKEEGDKDNGAPPSPEYL